MSKDYKEDNIAENMNLPESNLDMGKIQSAMHGEEQRQEKELQEDLEKFNNRPRPPWAEAPTQGAQKPNEGVNWEDKGIVDVPVKDLPRPDGVNSPQDFNHHISYPDTVEAFDELQKMKPLIDKGYTGDNFALIDRESGVDYANGQQRFYDLFYGNDAIKVNKDGNQYDIINGRHRIFVAKEKGYDSIPAHVTEKIKDSEDT